MTKAGGRKRIFAGFIMAALVAVGIFWFMRERETGPSNQIVLYGNVDIRQVALSFQDTGRILRLTVDEGDRVRAGQLVAEIDPARYKATVEQLEGEVAAQKAYLKELLSGSRPQEIEKARAEVRAWEARLKNAELSYKRVKELSKTKYVSQQKLDDAKAALDAARAGLDAARQVLSLAIEGPRKEDITRAKANLKARQAALSLARERLKDTRLYAPSDGIIQDRILEPGAMASSKMPVFTLALTDPLWVRVYLPEKELGKVKEGMRAFITTDSYPGKRYEGWVGFISPVAEFTPKPVETTELRTKLVYRCRVFVRDPAGELRLGMPVTVTIPLNQKNGSGARFTSSPTR